jgi:hypothetical protein
MTQLVKKKKNKYQIDDSRIGNCSPSSFIEERHLRPRLRSLGIHWPVYLLFFLLFRWGLFISNKKRKERKNERKKEEEKKDMEANGFNSRLSIAFCGRAHT